MMDILKYFKKGLRGTILVNDSHFSYGSQWQAVETNLALDRWFSGDFASAEYTISIELGVDKKEIIKCLLTASPNEASVVVYGRASTTTDLVNVTAQVTNSYVELILSPKTDAQKGCKASFSATYFKSHT
jgi:hypothetical protein|tara:strand:+ start:5009 stop:5398 length:390 start_codon:yes stop_codon:yes gene_type:complete